MAALAADTQWDGRSQLQEVVAPGLYLTNAYGARKRDLLRENGITHVLVCAAELPERGR